MLAFPAHATQDPAVYRSVPNEKKQIAVTFDDGPHPILTPRILEILEKYQVRATFFMVGVNVNNYSEAAKAVQEHGHEIGNHTYSHRHLSQMNAAALQSDLAKCEEIIVNVCGRRPCLFRPPEGVVNQSVRRCGAEKDYSLILWSIDTKDWEVKNASKIADTVLKNIQPGDIILLHDYVGTQSKTPEALEIILPKLLAQGYEFVTVSELLQSAHCTSEGGGSEGPSSSS